VNHLPSTARRRLAGAVVLALALVGLSVPQAVAASTTASSASGPLTLRVTVSSPHDTVRKGDTVTVAVVASSATGKAVTLPDDAVLFVQTGTAGDGEGSMTGACSTVGAGGADYLYLDYAAELPTTLAAGSSVRCTYKHQITAGDVALGGVWGSAQYRAGGPYSDSSAPFVWYSFGTTEQITVTGTRAVGKKLTTKLGYWAVFTGKTSYRWLRNGKAISGATHASYTLTAADKGKKISVRVTRYEPGSTAWGSGVSDATGAIKAGSLTTRTPTIKGTAKVGKKLTAKVSGWKPTPSLTYRWYANGKAIPGATRSTYKVTSKVVGKKITVKVTGKKAGYTTVSKKSKATAKVKR